MTGRETGPGKEGAGLERRKVTAKSLEAMGYQGFQEVGGGEVEAPWALDYIAMAANNFPGSLTFQRDAEKREVRVSYGQDTGAGTVEMCIVRRMRTDELDQMKGRKTNGKSEEHRDDQAGG